jgi:hypothetical protein
MLHGPSPTLSASHEMQRRLGCGEQRLKAETSPAAALASKPKMNRKGKKAK